MVFFVFFCYAYNYISSSQIQPKWSSGNGFELSRSPAQHKRRSAWGQAAVCVAVSGTPQAYNPISNTKNHKDHGSWLSISYMARKGSDSQRLHDVMTSTILIVVRREEI